MLPEGGKDEFAGLFQENSTSSRGEREKSTSEEAGKSGVRELNPYFKEGGDGLPPGSAYFSRSTREGPSSFRRPAVPPPPVEEDYYRPRGGKSSSLGDPRQVAGSSAERHRLLSGGEAGEAEDLNKLAALRLKGQLNGESVSYLAGIDERIARCKEQLARGSRGIVQSASASGGGSYRLEGSTEDPINAMVRNERRETSSRYDQRMASGIIRNGRFGGMEDLGDIERDESILSDRRGARGSFLSRADGQAGRHGSRSERKRRGDDGGPEQGVEDGEKLLRQEKMHASLKRQGRMARAQERCGLCLDSSFMERSLVVAMGQLTYLAVVPPSHAVCRYHCRIVPMAHCASSFHYESADEVGEEVRNFKKCLLRAADSQGMQALFLESVLDPVGTLEHFRIDCIFVNAASIDPRAYFKKAILEGDEEWGQHRRLIDTSKAPSAAGDGGHRRGLRGSIPRNFPYIYVDFRLDEGYAHLVEDAHKMGRTFLIDAARHLCQDNMYRREDASGRPGTSDRQARDDFERIYRAYDWTLLLLSTDEQQS